MTKEQKKEYWKKNQELVFRRVFATMPTWSRKVFHESFARSEGAIEIEVVDYLARLTDDAEDMHHVYPTYLENISII